MIPSPHADWPVEVPRKNRHGAVVGRPLAVSAKRSFDTRSPPVPAG
jgi:hypothetical protein